MLIHPSLRPFFDPLPETDWMADVPGSRAAMRAMEVPAPPDPRIAVSERSILGPDGNDVPLRIYRPTTAEEAPLLLWIHGGGFALGGFESEDANCRLMAGEHDLVVVSVDYRLAPEHPFPAGFEDAYQALMWSVANAGELSAASSRVGVAGHSAGATLAAGVALAARDRGGPNLSYLFLGYPVLDDDPRTVSYRSVVDGRLWTGAQAESMWSLYLPSRSAAVSPYAAPARAESLAGLPSTYVSVHGSDPHRDEALRFIERLAADDVLVEAHLVPGAPHMADVYAPEAPIIARAVGAWSQALAQGLHKPAAVASRR